MYVRNMMPSRSNCIAYGLGRILNGMHLGHREANVRGHPHESVLKELE
jgi:hypothetical protein